MKYKVIGIKHQKKDLTVENINKELDLDVKLSLIQKYGLRNFIQDSKFEPIEQFRNKKLFKIKIGNNKILTLLEADFYDKGVKIASNHLFQIPSELNSIVEAELYLDIL